MRLFDYAVQERGADPARARSAARSASRICSSSATTRGCACRARSACATSASRFAGRRRREPRHPAGLLPRRARIGPRRADRGGRRPARRSRVFSGSATITDGRIRHFSLPNSLDAINGTIHFDSRGIRLDDVTATMGGGPRAVRRPHRLRRLPAGRPERHRARRGHAPALSRGRPLDRRRRPVAARQRQGADARRHGDGEERALDPAHRHAGQHLRSRRRGDRRPAGAPSGRAGADGSAAVRRPDAACRRRCASRTTWRGWSPAPT